MSIIISGLRSWTAITHASPLHDKLHHDAICVVDMEGSMENLEFHQSINGCVIRFNTISDKADVREDSLRGCTHPVKQIIDVGTVERGKE